MTAIHRGCRSQSGRAEQSKTASPFKSTNCSHKLKGHCLLSAWCVCGRSFLVLRLLRPAKALLKSFTMHWAQPKMEQEVNQLWENMSDTFCYTAYWACLLFLPTLSSWIGNSKKGKRKKKKKKDALCSSSPSTEENGCSDEFHIWKELKSLKTLISHCLQIHRSC